MFFAAMKIEILSVSPTGSLIHVTCNQLVCSYLMKFCFCLKKQPVEAYYYIRGFISCSCNISFNFEQPPDKRVQQSRSSRFTNTSHYEFPFLLRSYGWHTIIAAIILTVFISNYLLESNSNDLMLISQNSVAGTQCPSSYENGCF